MQELCPCCDRHCPSDDLHCRRGKEHFQVEDNGQHNHEEHHDHHDHHEHHGAHPEHRGHHEGHEEHGRHEGHEGHGAHAEEKALVLLRQCGHYLHHSAAHGEGSAALLSVLSAEEKASLEALLQKCLDAWKTE